MDKSVNYVEIQVEQVENRNLCKGRKLLYIRGKVEVLLSYIGRNDIFGEYTEHSIKHNRNWRI